MLNSLSQLPTQRQMVIKLAGERAIVEGMQRYNQSIAEVTNSLPVDEVELAIAHNKGYLLIFYYSCS